MDFATTPLADIVNNGGSAGLQTYVVIMLALVAVMTIMDVIHKRALNTFLRIQKKQKLKLRLEWLLVAKTVQ